MSMIFKKIKSHKKTKFLSKIILLVCQVWKLQADKIKSYYIKVHLIYRLQQGKF